MKLSQLVGAIENKQWAVQHQNSSEVKSDPEITSVHYRSQAVLPGGIFIAIKGFSADGHQYVEDAISRGAKAVIVEQETEAPGAVVVKVDNTRKALAAISSRFYDDPSRHLCIVGVTGTNGKTTTTYIIENILKQAGLEVGVIGTINYRFGVKTFDNPVTTPESLELQGILAQMRQAGVTHVVMEVSSHAIDLCRVDDCWFDVGVFTNLTQDHLDFHNDMETYWSTKKRYFTDILASGPKHEKAVAVVNCNDEYGKELFGSISMEKLSVGFMNTASVHSAEVKNSLAGIEGILETPSGQVALQSELVGAYNVENILCAAGAGIALTLSNRDIADGIAATKSIPGRLEAVPNELGKFVYVDYAHTPDALENALKTLEALKTGKIICVFGCGGNRDRGKRPQMGEIAGRISDLSVITTDNPRNEDPMEIIWEIEKGLQEINSHCFTFGELKNGLEFKGYIVIPDRERAIRFAITLARPGDIVLIAGKGHETYQIVGDRVLDFDDKDVATRALQNQEAAI